MNKSLNAKMFAAVQKPKGWTRGPVQMHPKVSSVPSEGASSRGVQAKA
jgi:hypothetical protein